MTFKPLEFPSRHFPGANLRVDRDTRYVFTCPACSTHLTIPFGWLLHPGSPPAPLSKSQENEVRLHFQASSPKPGNHFDLTQCPGCHANYIVQSQITETSNGAYLALISGVDQVNT